MKKMFLGLVLGTVLSFNSFATTVNQTLYIVADSLLTVDSTLTPYITFNETPAYSQSNPIINLMQGDTLDLWVYNTDSVLHEFVIKGVSSVVSIPANDSAFVQTVFTAKGSYIYHDPSDFPKNTYLGLAGMIVVKNHPFACFYWNIKEHNSDWNNQLFAGNTVDWSQYDPKYFTINSVSNPNINLDPIARITGEVGETLFLYITNTGQSIHSMHFHGYHATIKYSSRNPSHLNREKDTFPIYPMETIVLKIVPDKEGEFPIHDHNLVAVTGNNIYPNGMFSTILITP
jgi:FtsP/CotA-like multicopper oxidase with cupredoxin domain